MPKQSISTNAAPGPAGPKSGTLRTKKASKRQNGNDISSSTDPAPVGEAHRMRITSGGSIQAYVDFAVNFLCDNPHTPLILHTLPPSPPSNLDRQPKPIAVASRAVQEADVVVPNSDHIDIVQVQAGGPSTSSSASTSAAATSSFLPCTLAVPRLISVVEIIKRAYVERAGKYLNRRQGGDGAQGELAAGSGPELGEAVPGTAAALTGNSTTKGKGKGKDMDGSEDITISAGAGPQATPKGIWQYTQSGLYHPPCSSSAGGTGGDAGTSELERVLGGRTKPKMIHHPYLSITLSTRPLHLETRPNTSVQYVLVKRRRNKRQKGTEAAGEKGMNAEKEADRKQLDGGVGVEDSQAGGQGARKGNVADIGKEPKSDQRKGLSQVGSGSGSGSGSENVKGTNPGGAKKRKSDPLLQSIKKRKV